MIEKRKTQKRLQVPNLRKMCTCGMSWDSEGKKLPKQMQRLEKQIAERGIYKKGCTRLGRVTVAKGGWATAAQ
jgi:hypothetical protein